MSRLVTAAAGLLAAASLAGAGPFDDLLKDVPPNTNTLVMVNVKAAFETPLAKQEKWAEEAWQRYRSGGG